MKKLIVTMLAAILASGALAQAFPDIPENHWAGDAVTRAADLGIVIGFPDGTFRGNESFTRYQAALVISRMLDVFNENLDARMAMTEEDLASLRNAVEELASDVASQDTRLGSAESAIEGLTGDLQGVSDNVADNAARLDELEAALAEAGSDIDPSALQDLENQVASQRVAIDTAQATADEALATAEEALAAAQDAQNAAENAQATGEGAQAAADDAQAAADAAQSAADAAQAAADEAQATADEARNAADGAQGAAEDAQATADAAQSAADDAQATADAAQATADEALAAAQQAQATAEGAQDSADEALDRANAAGSNADANTEEIAALNDLVQLLSNQMDELEAQIGQGPEFPADLEDRVARNEGDIANIREFVILLRRDQVALRDRVSALESSDEQQSADIADLQDRVTALEENPLGMSGEISVEYFVGRHIGDGDFDVDRAFGLNNERDTGASTFSSGTSDVDDDDDADEVGERAQDRADIDSDQYFDASLTLDFSAGSTFDSEGSPRALNSFSGSVELSVKKAVNLEDEDGDTFEGYVFSVDSFQTTFDFIGAEPLTFIFGEEVETVFTPYTLNREGVGFLAEAGAPDMLQFLDPTLWVAYGTDEPGDLGVADQHIVTGVRATVAPADFLTLGGSFVRDAVNTGDKDDVLGDNDQDTVWGVDATVALGPATLAGEFAQSSGSDGGAAFAELSIDGDALPIVNLFEANYRDIAGDWEDATPTDAGDYPYDEDQAGVGVDVGFGLFILDVTGYYDMYATGDPFADTTAFGVDAEADLFAGFALTGFFHQASATFDDGSVDGTIDSTDYVGTERDDNGYDTGFGVGITHDGDADNALIDNLDLEFAFEQLGVGFDQQHILASADYELSVSIVTLTPYAAYESFDDGDGSGGADGNNGTDNDDDTTEVRVGTGLTTEPLDIFLAPSLEAAVNYRTTSHDDPTDGQYTAEELQWTVGIALNEFLFDNSSLTARYGSYSGTNVAVSDVDGEGATDISAGDANNDQTQSVNGYELEWNYYDLMMAYGVFTHSREDAGGGVVEEGSAQAFRVGYTVTF